MLWYRINTIGWRWKKSRLNRDGLKRENRTFLEFIGQIVRRGGTRLSSVYSENILPRRDTDVAILTNNAAVDSTTDQ
jgi:hypothetical protein